MFANKIVNITVTIKEILAETIGFIDLPESRSSLNVIELVIFNSSSDTFTLFITFQSIFNAVFNESELFSEISSSILSLLTFEITKTNVLPLLFDSKSFDNGIYGKEE